MVLELSSGGLARAHAALLAGLLGLSAARPGPRGRYTGIALGAVVVLVVPILWIGRSATTPRAPVAWGFYLPLMLSLAMPFLAAAAAILLQGRRAVPASPAVRLGITLAAYLFGLTLSYPVSFNYSLFYFLIR
ncbi:MAG TPA: hypothetical protein VMG41_16880 [Gemmatimonadales bacterium]|nr:hypothetical protein [Gemmatimonadales bacterium]